MTKMGNSFCSSNHLILDSISTGPVEQFNPKTETPMSLTVVYADWTFVPSNILPYLSKVTLDIIGTFFLKYSAKFGLNILDHRLFYLSFQTPNNFFTHIFYSRSIRLNGLPHLDIEIYQCKVRLFY